jgi:D-arginine dehydrogenase
MNEYPRTCDILVIGAGIAGASAAAELAAGGARVVLAEMEGQPGYHTTGRSAATFVACYGNDVIRALNAASRPFFDAPPEGFSEYPLLAPRGALYVGDAAYAGEVEAALADPLNRGLLERLDTAQALAVSPALRPEAVALAAHEPDAADIDVNALLQGYLRRFKQAGGVLLPRAQVTALLRRAGAWRAETRAGAISAPLVVNAAGAWADDIAGLAGTQPIGLVPKRRTALTIDPGLDIACWPLTISADESWYFRPEGGDLLISPADETPSQPCDAQPDEMDIALCLDRIESVTTMQFRRLVSKRAGLRCFVYDKSPVAGFSDDVEGFFWLAGQGGYGIQTAPALSAFARGLILEGEVPAALAARGLDVASLSPARLRG